MIFCFKDIQMDWTVFTDVVITVSVLFIWLAEDTKKMLNWMKHCEESFRYENPYAEYFIMLLWCNDDKQKLMYKPKVIKKFTLLVFPCSFSLCFL